MVTTNVWLDVDDNAAFNEFKPISTGLMTRPGSVPPELRVPGGWTCVQGQRLTIASDIFQLGCLIWCIAEHTPCTFGAFCRKYGCVCWPRYRCRADHCNPIELPACQGQDVPAHINKVIEHCRHRDPSSRLAASNLLELLPHTNNHHNPWTGQPTTNPARDEMICDECSLNYGVVHHCSICNGDNFDLCVRCVSEGVTCWSATHRLQRRKWNGDRYIIV